jgi:1-acyl-sn-glycerol-3-phosphate acyltransferase
LILLRSMIFQVALVLLTGVFSSAIALLGQRVPLRVIGGLGRRWGYSNLWVLERLCGLKYRIEGWENVPSSNLIVMCKHQSAWETIALRAFLPVEQTWVLKKELLRIPILGPALRQFKPIAIDRTAGRKALKQLVTEGQELLHNGRWLVVFPEGTRVAPGEKGSYNVGGALLAERSGYPILPIAHNAGVFWGRRSIRKYAGTIDVVVGPLIETRNKSAQAINREVEDWIEAAVAALPQGRGGAAAAR